MRFEIDYKPRKLVFQRKTKAGKWHTLNEIVGTVPFEPETVYNMVVYYATVYDTDIRVLSGKGHQYITTGGIDLMEPNGHGPAAFYRCLNTARLVTAKHDRGPITVFGKNNSCAPSIDTVWDYLEAHGGLLKYRPYAITAEDNYIWCGKVRCNDGAEFTIAFYY